MQKKYPLGNFRHKIEICDSVSKPVKSGAEKADRVPLHDKPIRAMIDGRINSFRINSFRINSDDREKATHIFVIRERCDFEPSAGQWIYRSYRGRDEWYLVLGVSDVSEGYINYTRLICAIWTRDSVRLDPETQDIPCEDIAPDMPPMDYRDFI